MNNRRNKGFTLIELLAVIVILAVIALIATPLIMNVINDAKKGAARDSGYNIIKAGEQKAAIEQINNVNPPYHYDENSNLDLKGTKPDCFTLDINDEMDTQLRAWLNGYCVVKEYGNETVTIDESKKSEEDCVTGSNTSKVEKPVIKDGMIPVTFDSSGKTVKADTRKEWYNYDNKKWANAVSVTNESREKYKNASAGTEIDEPDILGYFVWIPRYRYQLWNAEGGQANEQEIKIEFERRSTEKSKGTKNGEWLTHPAFTFGTTELTGLWVGKFELTGSTTTPTTKPNQKSLISMNMKTTFDTIQKMSTTSNYGLSSYDAHMMKNSEWGAVAYLSHSKYGKNSEVWINNVNTGTGEENNGVQRGPSITGCSGTSASAEVKNNMTACEEGRDYKQAGVNASTTGNITGIYDMSGGVWERVMASVVQEDGSFIPSSSGFTEKPDSKYYEEYDYNTSSTNFNISKLGDAIKETRKGTSGNAQNWYGGYTYIPNSVSSWFALGGYASNGSHAGLFCVSNTNGGVSMYYGGRAVIVSE